MQKCVAIAAAVFLSIFAWLSNGALAEVAVPSLTARINDHTGTLSQPQRAALEEKLKAFETSKGTQLAVLIVPTTQPETIEQYSLRVAEQWKLGRKDVDDGALLIVAKDDRAMRIEVGYGLEGVIPDAIGKRIISETITPYFQRGDFYAGVTAGLDQLISLIEGESLPPPRRTTGPGPSNGNISSFLPVAFFIVFIAAGFFRMIFGRFFGAIIAGGIGSILFWLLVSSVIGAIVAGFFIFIFTLGAGIGGSGPRGGFGRGFPGGFGGGGFGGGGFGGGGGGFGGGGASGRW